MTKVALQVALKVEKAGTFRKESEGNYQNSHKEKINMNFKYCLIHYTKSHAKWD